MEKPKKKRIDQWIYTRMWNAKIDGKILSTRQLFIEVNTIFKLNIPVDDYVGRQNINYKIKRTRNAVNKRFARRLEKYEVLAIWFNVPEKMIMRWSEGGLFNISNPNEIDRIQKIISERDFFHDLPSDNFDERIPMDINEHLRFPSD